MHAIRTVRRPAASALIGAAMLTCALAAASGCVRSETRAQTRDGARSGAPGGAIEGRIAHPAQAVPAMRICAIGSGAPQEAKRVCVRTQPDQARYRIDGLPADDYTVFARVEGDAPAYRIGGHMQQVQCIRAPCPEMPASVAVGENARVDGVDINHFYDKRDDFPAF